MPFPGFPARCAFTPVPAPFFGPLLEEIDDLAELKTALRVLHLLHRKKGPVRYVSLGEVQGDIPLARALRGEKGALERALEACVRRGVFLAVGVERDGRRERLFFLNTPQGRAAAQRVAAEGGEILPPPPPADASQPPNIYRLYEENIGVLTPMVAELLKDAETAYPAEWIVEAMREAVRHNQRRWGYVEAILRRWAREGKGSYGATGGPAQKGGVPSRGGEGGRPHAFPV
jgi:DNA replication protein